LLGCLSTWHQLNDDLAALLAEAREFDVQLTLVDRPSRQSRCNTATSTTSWGEVANPTLDPSFESRMASGDSVA
jgi:hypothetical protein